MKTCKEKSSPFKINSIIRQITELVGNLKYAISKMFGTLEEKKWGKNKGKSFEVKR